VGAGAALSVQVVTPTVRALTLSVHAPASVRAMALSQRGRRRPRREMKAVGGGADSMTDYSAVIDALARAPDIVVPLVREVPAAFLKRRPAPRKWSAHEHACHLAHVHRLFFDRLDYMLTSPSPVITPYEPGESDPDDLLLSMDLAECLRRYVDDRARLVARLRDLPHADWQRTAEHGEYRHYSVFIMFRHLALHDFFHAYRIEELLLKKAWPGEVIDASGSTPPFAADAFPRLRGSS
jgi:hypothetical protein